MRLFLISVALVVVVSACGPRWYYPQLDWLLPWYVADYITLAPNQRTEFERRLARQLEWHCRSELPAYADFLRGIQRDLETPGRAVSTQQLMSYYTNITVYYHNLLRRIGPDVAAILRSASDAQIDELFDNLEGRNSELAARYVEPPAAVILENRTARMVDRLEDWLGELRADQVAAVRRWSKTMGADNNPWIANRRHVQQQLREVLQSRSGDPDFPSRLAALIASPDTLQSRAYRDRRTRRTALTVDLLTTITQTLSVVQRRHLQAYLGALADDFDHLACDAAKPHNAMAPWPGKGARRPPPGVVERR